MADPAPEPVLFVVFGATGDLMQRKMLPALLHLEKAGRFPDGSTILGVARRSLDNAAFQETARTALTDGKAGTDEEIRAFCTKRLRYYALDGEAQGGYAELGKHLAQIESEQGLPGNRVFYLALPLEAFAPTLRGLGEAGLNHGPGWVRVVVEKPFGRDLASAQELNQLVHQYFGEKQTFRIDHYLGKETVQNLLVFRFANMFVESLWNRERIEHIEITVAESLGVGHRADYYESAGALRDMLQNHVTQLLTLVAMEPPTNLDEDAIRNEKVKVLRSAVRLEPQDLVRGQYTAGTVGGKPVPGYREAEGVAPNSTTETYVALRLRISNWRWQGVPIFIQTGKCLAAKSSRVVVTFKAPPVTIFQTAEEYELNPDRITILIQPDEGFELAFEIKVPGREVRVQTHRMKFDYADVFGELADGYETLLLDVLLGDATLFVRADEVEESWRLYAPLLENPPPVVFYPAGTWGPPEAKRLVDGWGHRWNPP